MERFAVVGGGSGGKAVSVDLTLQGKRVRLFEFPEFAANIAGMAQSRRLTAVGVVQGTVVLDRVTTDLGEALDGAEVVMVCTQALTHDRAAAALAPLVTPEQAIVLNPGSTGGSLRFAELFRRGGMRRLPPLIETSTLTYGCRAKGDRVDVAVKAGRVLYGAMPAAALERFGPELERLFPGLRRGASVLEAGLNNANPVIHPAITLLNAAPIENEGDRRFFYRDGVSPAVAALIRKLDEERMALLNALGYPAQSDPLTSVEQGYAASADYYECYKNGPGYGNFRFPNTLDNRYFHEDMGMGLVFFCSLGKVLGVPTPVSETIVRMGEAISGEAYFQKGARTVEALGLAGLDREGIRAYLDTGVR